MIHWLRTILLGGTLLFSGVGAGVGFWKAQAYDATAGQAAAAAAQWPADCPLTRATDKATLIMAVHPECPCTRASMEELAQLATHCQGLVQIYVLFAQPAGLKEDPRASALWGLAALTGVTRIVDDHELAWRRFGARTSGQVLLYGRDGRLVFSGGITNSRGHAGDNDGLSALESYLSTGNMPVDHTPVFGCALR